MKLEEALGEQSLGRVLLPAEGITLGYEAGVAAQDVLIASLGHTRKCWRRDTKTRIFLLEAVLFLKHKSGASASELVTPKALAESLKGRSFRLGKAITSVDRLRGSALF